MKKLLIIVIALASMGNMQAQTGKGSVAFGLHNFSAIVPGTDLLAPTNAFGIYFGKSKSEFLGQTFEDKITTVGLSGSVHYFLIDNLSGGINLDFIFQKQEEDYGDRDEFSTTVIMAGPELRYYIKIGRAHV